MDQIIGAYRHVKSTIKDSPALNSISSSAANLCHQHTNSVIIGSSLLLSYAIFRWRTKREIQLRQANKNKRE